MRALLLCCLAVTLNSLSVAADTVRARQLMNFGWRFHAGDIADGESPQTSDADWRPVNLPHDFQIEQPWVVPGADERPDEN